MKNQTVEEVLQQLAKGTENRSDTARLRDIFETVEATIRAGVSRSAVLQVLNAQGFNMGMRSFENALYRIRKERNRINSSTSESPAELEPSNKKTTHGYNETIETTSTMELSADSTTTAHKYTGNDEVNFLNDLISKGNNRK